MDEYISRVFAERPPIVIFLYNLPNSAVGFTYILNVMLKSIEKFSLSIKEFLVESEMTIYEYLRYVTFEKSKQLWTLCVRRESIKILFGKE